MAFNRQGSPENIHTINIEKLDAVACQHCGRVVGTGSNNLLRLAGSNEVVIMSTGFKCPYCHKENHV